MKMILLNKKGMTLVELMISVAIIGVIVLGLGTLLSKGIQLWNMNKAKTEIERDTRVALDLITGNLKQARDSTIVIDSYNSSQPPYSRISFTTIKGDSITYYQKGRELYQNTDSGDYKLMNNLRHIIFTYIDTSTSDGDKTSVINCSVCAEVKMWASQSKVFELNFEKIRIMN